MTTFLKLTCVGMDGQHYKAPHIQILNVPPPPKTPIPLLLRSHTHTLPKWLAQLSLTELPHPSLLPSLTSSLGKFSDSHPHSPPSHPELPHDHRILTFVHHSVPRPRPSRSTTKRLERRLIRLWKRMTKTVRPNERASILPDGFVLMNAARRRSMMIIPS
jgi:hypothetical protein